MTFPSFAKGLLLGWSVAWPPGPINAEMIRRGLLPKNAGGGFWGAWPVGIGACTGDFLWAFAVSVGAGVFLNGPAVRRVLAAVSLALLLLLAWTFARQAWRIFQRRRTVVNAAPAIERKRGSFLLGLIVALTSPWNIGFWLAVIGSQQTQNVDAKESLAFAGAVVLGALCWTLVLCAAVKLGARVLSHPAWQIITQAFTSAVMLFFAIKLLLRFP